MITWLRRFLDGVAGRIGHGIADVISTVGGAIAGIFSTVSSDVTDAWRDLTANLDALAEAVRQAGLALYRHAEAVLRFWVPHFAVYAWWWVTHPDQLADSLFWYLIRWLEQRAWTVARYLGEFTLALVMHNMRRLALLAEDILHAVL